MLLANSVDRLIVVIDPVLYFSRHAVIVKALVSFAIAVPTIICVTASIVESSLPNRIIEQACM